MVIIDEINANLIIIYEMQIVRNITNKCVNYHPGGTLVKSFKKL